MENPSFRLGQLVEKYTGDYQVVGEVRAVFWTRAGKLRYVVELDPCPGLLYIFNQTQLRAHV